MRKGVRTALQLFLMTKHKKPHPVSNLIFKRTTSLSVRTLLLEAK
jgi:hypothetical protein